MKSKISRRRIWLIACLFLSVALLSAVGNNYLKVNLLRISNEAAKQQEYENAIGSLDEDIKEKEALIDSLRVKPNKEEAEQYVSEMNDFFNLHNVIITKLSIKPPEYRGEITVEPLIVEINGDYPSILQCLKYIQAGDRAIDIKSVSLRQNNDLLWLNREIDNLSILPWLDIEKDSQQVDSISEEQSSVLSPEEEIAIISQLFNHSDMLCYLELEYLR